MNSRFQRFQHRLGRARELRLNEWSMLGEAWVGLFVVDLVLRARGYSWLQARFEAKRGRISTTCGEMTRREVERCFELVVIAAGHHVRPMLCLRRAMTLQWLLLRRGIGSEVRVGAARGEEGLDVHAWLVWDETVIGEEPEAIARYRRLEGGRELN